MRKLIFIILAALSVTSVLADDARILPAPLDALLGIASGPITKYPKEYVNIRVQEKHVLVWAASEWLVLSLRAGGVEWAERKADAALVAVLEAGQEIPMDVFSAALNEAVSSDRLGAAVMILRKSGRCLNPDAINAALALSSKRDYPAMHALLELVTERSLGQNGREGSSGSRLPCKARKMGSE